MWLDVAFSSSKTGLGAVTYRLYNVTGGDAQAATNTGVVEIGNGAYGVEVASIPAATKGVEWSSGEGTPVWAHEDVFPGTSTLPQKGVAFSDIEFLMVAASDGRTPAVGLTVTAERSLDGGAFSAVGGAIAEVGDGIYQFDAAAADMNGSVITFKFSAATAMDTFLTVRTIG